MDKFQTDRIDIAFVTASDMPKPDEETHLIVAAVEDKGLRADIIPWDSSVDWAKIPLVAIRTTWDYFKRLPEFLAWARQVDEVTQLVNPFTVIEWNSHKRYLVDLEKAFIYQNILVNLAILCYQICRILPHNPSLSCKFST